MVVLRRRQLDLDLANKEAAAANQASREVAARQSIGAMLVIDYIRRQCMPSGSAAVYH